MRLSPYLACGGCLAAAAALSVFAGAESIPPADVARALLAPLGLGGDTSSYAATIVLRLRLPNAALMALIGGALGASGAAYQGLLRNPLADPYLIGVAPGAALGAVLAMTFLRPEGLLGLFAVPGAAFLGAILTVAAVYRVARVGKSAPVTSLVLAGVAVGAFVSALTWFLLLQTDVESRRVIAFMVGGYRLGDWTPVVASLPYMIVGVAILLVLARSLNVLQFGDEAAKLLGLDVERVKASLILGATLAAAAAVSFAGIIGFVGLIVPHVVRILWGPDHRRLVPLSILGGAATLLAADAIANAASSLRGLQVGIVTALLGVPLFLVVLRRERRLEM
jgi:iron complex transport system permease protein